MCTCCGAPLDPNAAALEDLLVVAALPGREVALEHDLHLAGQVLLHLRLLTPQQERPDDLHEARE